MTSGCYAYRVTDDAPVGSVARLRVPLQSAFADPNAPPDMVAVEGRILSVGDTIAFEASTRHVFGAFRDVVQYDTLRVARDGLATIEVREFSTTKSVLLGAGLAAGTTALALAAFGVETGDGGSNPGSDGPQTSVAPGVSVPVGTIMRWLGLGHP